MATQPKPRGIITKLAELEQQALALVAQIKQANPSGEAPRWANVARTEIQQGFMAAKRAAWGGDSAPPPPDEAA